MSLNLEKTLPISVKWPESKQRKKAVVVSKRSSLPEKTTDSKKSSVRIVELDEIRVITLLERILAGKTKTEIQEMENEYDRKS